MITKFIKVKNVGRLGNLNAGNITLDRVNIIYGENSTGKTTLCSIIRSLSKNIPNLIIERKTRGQKDDIYCEILYEENQKKYSCKFENNTWNKNLKDIEIFDAFFIDENVYTGLEIFSEHQKNLYQFALGEESVILAKEIENIKRENETKNLKLNKIENQIAFITKNFFTVEQFINLKIDSEIESKIKSKVQEIKATEDLEEIRKKPIFSTIPTFNFAFYFTIYF